MTENEFDADLLDFINENMGSLTRIRPDGFGITVQEFADHKGTSEDIARKALKKMEKKGLLKSELMVLPGKTGRTPLVFYQPDESPETFRTESR